MKSFKDHWDTRFMKLAGQVSEWSKDSHPVGCVAVSPDRREIVIGYNGFPRAIEDGDYTTTNRNDDRDLKLRYSVHAEMNMIANARRSLSGWRLYTTFMPCLMCAKALIASEINEIYCPPFTKEESERYDFTIAREIMERAYIRVYDDYPIYDDEPDGYCNG